MFSRFWRYFEREIFPLFRNQTNFLGALLPVLGGIGKAVVGTAVASTVGGYFDRRNAKKDYEQQRELGFTHSEIAGAGGAGAGSSAQEVMGNQMTQFEAQRRQQEYEEEQRNLDRAVAMRAQDMGLASAQTSAGATLGAAAMARDAAYNTAGTQFDIAAMNNDRQWQEMANKWANDNPELNLTLKRMSMGVENVQVEMVLVRNGLTPQSINNMSQAEFNRRMTAAMSEMAAMQGVRPTLAEGGRQGQAAINDLINQNDPSRPVMGVPVTPPMPNLPH
jgi:hypothetical protein